METDVCTHIVKLNQGNKDLVTTYWNYQDLIQLVAVSFYGSRNVVLLPIFKTSYIDYNMSGDKEHVTLNSSLLIQDESGVYKYSGAKYPLHNINMEQLYGERRYTHKMIGYCKQAINTSSGRRLKDDWGDFTISAKCTLYRYNNEYQGSAKPSKGWTHFPHVSVEDQLGYSIAYNHSDCFHPPCPSRVSGFLNRETTIRQSDQGVIDLSFPGSRDSQFNIRLFLDRDGVYDAAFCIGPAGVPKPGYCYMTYNWQYTPSFVAVFDAADGNIEFDIPEKPEHLATDLLAGCAETRNWFRQTDFVNPHYANTTAILTGMKSIDLNTIMFLKDLKDLPSVFMQLKTFYDIIRKLHISIKDVSSMILFKKYVVDTTKRDVIDLYESISSKLSKIASKTKPFIDQSLRTMQATSYSDTPYGVVAHTTTLCLSFRANHGFLSQVMQFLYEWDITPSLTHIWDFLPYSFVINWFTGIDKVIEDEMTFVSQNTLFDLSYCIQTDYLIQSVDDHGWSSKLALYKRRCTREWPAFGTSLNFDLPVNQWVAGTSLAIQRI